jgi:MoaA/NifB/PqqE/SkfB family radical SAM enzyme
MMDLKMKDNLKMKRNMRKVLCSTLMEKNMKEIGEMTKEIGKVLSFLTMETIQKSINNIDMRRDWIDKGKKDAQNFLEKLKNKNKEKENDSETAVENL